MDIFLAPDHKRPQVLQALYEKAFREAQELYIATAYLTDWSTKSRVSSSCDRLVFVVGTDFGLTRKSALSQVLKWLPRRGAVLFGAVSGARSGGFHPKLLLWRTVTGTCYCIIGSSNLSRAAFSTNYEANVFTRISSGEYRRLAAWIDSIAEQSAEVTEDWITHHYREAKRPAHQREHRTGLTPVVKLHLPSGPRYATRVRQRREAQAAFPQIAAQIRAAARRCAAGRMSNSNFWDEFWNLWSAHDSRFQGKGLEMSGKSANWRQACTALVSILDAAERSTGPELDHVVSGEIDSLAKAHNASRGAWLSEMLCHYLPDRYPLLNGPIKQWLKANHWRARRGSSEGQRYTQLAQQLRLTLRSKPAGAKTLAELDAAIWQWVQDKL